MRNMSFSMTTQQMRDGTKTVTRRLGWKNLKTGDLVRAVVKGMGLKKGQKVDPIVVIEIVDVRREPLDDLEGSAQGKYSRNSFAANSGYKDVVAEGFPEMDCPEFIDMFCAANRCATDTEIARIEFKHRLDLSTCCGADVEGWPVHRRPCLLECSQCGKVCGMVD